MLGLCQECQVCQAQVQELELCQVCQVQELEQVLEDLLAAREEFKFQLKKWKLFKDFKVLGSHSKWQHKRISLAIRMKNMLPISYLKMARKKKTR